MLEIPSARSSELRLATSTSSVSVSGFLGLEEGGDLDFKTALSSLEVDVVAGCEDVVAMEDLSV